MTKDVFLKVVSFDKLAILFTMFILIWNYYAITAAFSYAVTYDEVTFYKKALQHFYMSDFIRLLAQKNEYGYGGAWFSIYSLMIYISQLVTGLDYSFLQHIDSTVIGGQVENTLYLLPLILMKLINILSIDMLFLIFLQAGKKNNIANYGGIFLLITPMLYWSGKWASPDILASSIAALGFYLYFFKNKKSFAMVIFALAVSIKVSVFPAILIVFGYEIVNLIRDRGKRLKGVVNHGLLIIVVFFTLNGYFFINPIDYIETLQFYANNHSNDISTMAQLFSSSDIRLFRLGGSAWDLVFLGSLAYWAIHPIIFIVFFLLSSKNIINIATHLLFIILFIVSFIFILRQSTYGWNWFPFIMIFSLIFLNFRKTAYMHFLSVLFILVGLFYSYENIKLEIRNKSDQIKNINIYRDNKVEINSCIGNFIKTNKLSLGRTVNYSEIQVEINKSQFLNSYWSMENKYQLNDMILIGDRTQKNLPRLKNEILKYKYREAKCSFISIYFIEGKK
jgi:hypothetical protein